MSLKNKTVTGVLWNAFEIFGGQLIQIVITIFLARILAPEDFGIIGLLIIFTELSKVILDSGFSQALIRKKDANQIDFSSVFYFNIALGILLYSLLYTISPAISRFYVFPELNMIARVIFLTILINSFGIVQNAKIVREVNFKILSKRSIIANLIAGIVAIILAYKGYGVWALVWQMVIASFLRVGLLWSFSKWLPSLIFSFKPITELFVFSGNILLSGIFDVIASNIQTLLIGKFYTKTDLGFYSQANQLSRIPSQTFTSIIRNVTYPTLSVIQDNVKQLKQAYRKVIQIAVFIVFPFMFGLMAIGNNLIPLLIGEKWIPSIPYFMLLCIIGAVLPLYSISQNIFLVRGNSKLHLKVSMVKRTITLITIIVTIKFSVLTLVIGQVIATVINTIITMIYSGKEIKYSLYEQIDDLKQIFYFSLIMASITFLIGELITSKFVFVTVLIQIIVGIIVYYLLSLFFKTNALTYLITIINDLKSKSY